MSYPNYANHAQCVLALIMFSFSGACLAQHDPGLRGVPPGAGSPLPGLTPIELSVFKESLQRAIQLEGVCDDCSDVTIGTFLDPAKANFATQTNSSGLGVRFNGDQCTVCHNHPALGGSGGFMVPNPQDPPALQRAPENPMFDLIPHRKGAANAVPSFIKQYGPIREVRFAFNPDGTPDGGVHQLFTIDGSSDVSPAQLHERGCTTDGFRDREPPRQCSISHPIAAVRSRHPGWNPGSGDHGAPCGLGTNSRRSQDHGRTQPQRQRWVDHPLRLEGAEQVDRDLLRRGLQRRDGRDQ